MVPAHHDVTIRCPRDGQELYARLDAEAGTHLLGGMQVTYEGARATITLVTTDLDAIRSVLSAHAPNATSMRVDL